METPEKGMMENIINNRRIKRLSSGEQAVRDEDKTGAIITAEVGIGMP
jgi:hypothetical protein